MPGQLNVEGTESEHGTASGAASPSRWPGRGRVVLGLVLVGAALGVLTGWLWELVWTPPTGAAWQGEWFLDRQGLPREVDGTAWFTLIGAVTGLLLGAVAARFVRGEPLAVLVGVVVGSLVLAWVMFQVGHSLGPEDPHRVARTAGDWDPIVSDLTLGGVENRWWPFRSTATLAPAVGALISLVGVFLGSVPRRRH